MYKQALTLVDIFESSCSVEITLEPFEFGRPSKAKTWILPSCPSKMHSSGSSRGSWTFRLETLLLSRPGAPKYVFLLNLQNLAGTNRQSNHEFEDSSRQQAAFCTVQVCSKSPHCSHDWLKTWSYHANVQVITQFWNVVPWDHARTRWNIAAGAKICGSQ